MRARPALAARCHRLDRESARPERDCAPRLETVQSQNKKLVQRSDVKSMPRFLRSARAEVQLNACQTAEIWVGRDEPTRAQSQERTRAIACSNKSRASRAFLRNFGGWTDGKRGLLQRPEISLKKRGNSRSPPRPPPRSRRAGTGPQARGARRVVTKLARGVAPSVILDLWICISYGLGL